MAKNPKKDDRNIEELVDVLDRVAFQLNGCQQIFNTLFNNNMEDEEYENHLAKFQPSLVVSNSYLIISIQMLNEILEHYESFGTLSEELIQKCNAFKGWVLGDAKRMRNHFAAHPFQDQYVDKVLERRAISRSEVAKRIVRFFGGDMTCVIRFYNDDFEFSLTWIQNLISELKQNWVDSK